MALVVRRHARCVFIVTILEAAMGGWRRTRSGAVLGALVLVGALAPAGSAQGVSTSARAGAASGTTTRVSVSSSGAQANHDAGASETGESVSADGRYVAFSSDATNLVAGDTNRQADVFVRDLQVGTTSRVSVSSSGAQANSYSYDPAISADGRYVAFYSDADDLVAGDTLHTGDVFVRDLQAGTTSRVSVSRSGAQANGPSYESSISADGRYVAFTSDATNLVAGDTNGNPEVFVHDVQAGTTSRVSVSSSGTQANSFGSVPSISANGRYVVFASGASNLVAGDTNGGPDVFVRDLQAGTTGRVSVSGSGAQADRLSFESSISAEGRYVAFYSEATNLIGGDTNGTGDVFVRDLQAGTTSRVSVSSSGTQANRNSFEPVMSADGRYVAFTSDATNLVAGDTNGNPEVFVHDVQAGTTGRVSVSSSGTQANSVSYHPAISGDGRYVAFYSNATNLVAGDTNGTPDVFVRDRGAPSPVSDGKYAVLTGANEVPGPGDRDGRGVALVKTYLAGGATTGRVCADISATRLGPSARTAAHIHAGQAGVAGPVVVDLTAPLLGTARCAPGVSADLIRAIRERPARFYVNVHTEQFPAGAIRGQLHG